MEVVNPTASEASGPADEDPETDAICTLLQEATESNQCTVDDTNVVKSDHGSELDIAHHVGKWYVFQFVNALASFPIILRVLLVP
jgi:hypothetical protein